MLLILILLVSLVNSKPQGSPPNLQEGNVQIEKQELRELTQHELESSTRDIMEKIREINHNHRLLPKTANVPQRVEFSKQFYNQPDYPYDQKLKVEELPAQYIRRKVTHQQSVMTPAFMQVPYYPPPFGFAKQPPQQPDLSLENQTIENVRNVISMQAPPLPYMVPYYYPVYPPEMDYPQLRQGFLQSPITSYFPIVIKDPLQQLINAFTSMIEYGPPPNNVPAPLCEGAKRNNKEGEKELVIEDLRLTNDNQNPLQFTLKVDSGDESRHLKGTSMRINNKLSPVSKVLSKSKEGNVKTGIFPLGVKEKSPTISHDNTGNGIFVQKLRVREGGIAIAGPGGIATAGTGGTAIVGPDGYAYTQPDSIAIAGSGTKVVAVNPDVDLTELINTINKNETKISPRIGKIVAVGPVVYYNKGWVVVPLHFHPPSKSVKLTSFHPENQQQKSLTESHINESLSKGFEEDLGRINANKVIPHKSNPLFIHVKNVGHKKVYSIRNNDAEEKDTSTLILKPMAKAVAGQDGKAIALPVAKALVRKGTNVDILYEPEAVAIAGPGGIAHAQSDLEIFYEEIV